MELRSAPIENDASSFQCPSCGLSAFEVVGTHVDLSLDGRREASLDLKCLSCLKPFHHRLQAQELPAMPVPEAEPQVFAASRC
jgi:uncharacterized metal-binding protein YceD (DUF177 family)